MQLTYTDVLIVRWTQTIKFTRRRLLRIRKFTKPANVTLPVVSNVTFCTNRLVCRANYLLCSERFVRDECNEIDNSFRLLNDIDCSCETE